VLDHRLFDSLALQGFLSFGPVRVDLALEPLNVLIGPNGSGKSNVLEAFSLLQAAPRDLLRPVREGGGVGDWLWKGSGESDRAPAAVIEVVTAGRHPGRPPDVPLRYRLAFGEEGQRFRVADERLENAAAKPGHDKPYFYFGYEKGRPMLNVSGGAHRELQRDEIGPEQSILSQRKDPDQYPELTWLGEILGRITIYRDWCIGRHAAPRRPQKADLPNDYLLENASNLGLVLNRLRRGPAWDRLISELRNLYPGIDDVDVSIEGGTVQVVLHEGRRVIPATRLSDGTVRYLCLLAVLCHPQPPPFVGIEEPELGLHPDVLPGLADLLVDASSRTQLLVTTHSDILVDALTSTPESVVTCEMTGGSTVLGRLSQKELRPWLEKYRLGELWTRGEIGGTRW
jgi:predicted ATPase